MKRIDRLTELKHHLNNHENTSHIDWDSIAATKVLEGLFRDAKTLRRLYEHMCNGCTRDKAPQESWKAYDKARDGQMEWVDTRERVINKRIAKRLAGLSVDYYLQRDPRGGTLYLGTTSNNNYNAEGVFIR